MNQLSYLQHILDNTKDKSYNKTPMQDVLEGASEITSSEKRFQNDTGWE